MFKMAILLAPLFFFFLCISVSGQELLKISTFHHQDSSLHSISHTLGVSVRQNEVSSTVLMAEKWLRTHVLSRYPSTNITSIVVTDNNLLCEKDQERDSRMVLFAMENVHHSLVRWGLEKKIRVSVLLNPNCPYRFYLKRVFELLEGIHSTCTVETHDFSDQSVGILSDYLKSMADLGVFRSKSLNVMKKLKSSVSRKLSSELDYSVPSDAAAVTPLPPLVGVTSPPTISLPFAPAMQPPANTAHPPYGLNLPPCNPYPNPHHRREVAAPPPASGGGATAEPPFGYEQMWCVAKPSVPSEKLQEAMDFACGVGGADCAPISPAGSCYFPDNVVAHASYAFNSYWQKNKKNGGTCGFGGTAMLISSDPSFLQCHFTVA